MSKSKKEKDNSSATIYIKYDAEMGQKEPGYVVRWNMLKEETQEVSLFVRELHEYYGVPKKAFNSTLGMNNSVLNKYFDIPEDCCLSRDAIERMAVCIILIEPQLNKVSEFKDSCKKEGINFKGVIPGMNDKELEDMRAEFCKTFGPLGTSLAHTCKSVKRVLEMNEFYYNKFTNMNQKYNDKQHD